ncbi:glycosyltransferase [Streptococcus suis]
MKKQIKKTVLIAPCLPSYLLDKYINDYSIQDVPAYRFSWNIVKGLKENGLLVEVISELKIVHDSKKNLSCKEEIDGVDLYLYVDKKKTLLGFLAKTIIILKYLISLKPNTILVYSLHTPYLLSVFLFSIFHPSRKIIFVPDLPMYMRHKMGWGIKILKIIDNKFQENLLKGYELFVLLTEEMKTVLNVPTSKYIVMEGIFDSSNYAIEKSDRTEKYILYTGAIEERYGCKKLLEDFLASKQKYELWFCGKGEFVEELKKICINNKKVKYLGFLNIEKVRNLQTNASLLINPRSASDTYTRFSFPSKTMEYLASGTPVMMEKLPGVPVEYYKYILEIIDGDITQALNDFYDTPDTTLNEISISAKNFIIKNKNTKVQMKQIFELLD